MKTIASALLVAGLLIGSVADANAVVCAKGAYHAGCAGPHGAAVGHRPYGYGYHGAPPSWRGRPMALIATGAPACASAADPVDLTKRRRSREGLDRRRSLGAMPVRNRAPQALRRCTWC